MDTLVEECEASVFRGKFPGRLNPLNSKPLRQKSETIISTTVSRKKANKRSEANRGVTKG